MLDCLQEMQQNSAEDEDLKAQVYVHFLFQQYITKFRFSSFLRRMF